MKTKKVKQIINSIKDKERNYKYARTKQEHELIRMAYNYLETKMRVKLNRVVLEYAPTEDTPDDIDYYEMEIERLVNSMKEVEGYLKQYYKENIKDQ